MHSEVEFDGNSELLAETLMAYELGYRVQPAKNLSLDMTAFYNVYDRLRSFERRDCELENAGDATHFDCEVKFDNKANGEAYGFEATADWRPHDNWRLRAGYSYFKLMLNADAGSLDPNPGFDEGLSPRHQFYLQSFLSLPRQVQFDLGLRFVDSLPNQRIDSYVTLDTRLAWKPRRDLELSLVGQNLVADRHQEFGTVAAGSVTPTVVERGFYGNMRWSFQGLSGFNALKNISIKSKAYKYAWNAASSFRRSLPERRTF